MACDARMQWSLVCDSQFDMYHFLMFVFPAAFLGDEILSDTQLTIRCNYPSPEGWSQSLDGSSRNAVRLNTSSVKYTVNGITLNINNVDKTDEGLYSCIYQHGATSRELCVYVYGMFAITELMTA